MNNQSTDLGIALQYLSKEIYGYKKSSPEFILITNQINTLITLIITNNQEG